MHVTLDELMKYLESLVEGNYHGKVTIGVFGGKISSIKLDASVDLNAVKAMGGEDEE